MDKHLDMRMIEDYPRPGGSCRMREKMIGRWDKIHQGNEGQGEDDRESCGVQLYKRLTNHHCCSSFLPSTTTTQDITIGYCVQ
ncbi:hypothetical protein Pcinc_028672 [Petrolisthes cinctipes]|uniref:Uncharacterized protein n=1 Tax=Petrolisthes cinctipes TaxID=88211 RepID=A0AAE1F1W2_PETCI|nr:hypothetical protein Pcinc_041600 [Petrolisthes cinctipes]KAK3865737.1 hypothetical protein Pcinc_028672 [Petrolisthes cinctipes]